MKSDEFPFGMSLESISIVSEDYMFESKKINKIKLRV